MKTEWANLFGEEGPVFVSGVVASVHPDLTDGNIDELVANFDASVHEPPVCVGHPKDNSPAYGWVSKLWKEGKDLLAEMALLPEFAEMLKKQVFKKRSIAFYTDFEGTGKKVLRHIGFLGGMPPRIKGMPDLVFADVDGEFSEVELRAISELNWRQKDLSSVLRNLKNDLIERVGAESADKIIPEFSITQLAAEINLNHPNPDGMPIYQDESKEDNTMNYTQEQHEALLAAALDKQKKDIEAQFADKVSVNQNRIKELETENTGLKSSVREFADKAAKAEVEQFCDTQVKAAKMAPAEKDGFVNLYMELGDEARGKLKDNVAKRPAVLTFGEQATSGNDRQPGQKGLTEADKLLGLTEKDVENYGDMEEYRPVITK